MFFSLVVICYRPFHKM